VATLGAGFPRLMAALDKAVGMEEYIAGSNVGLEYAELVRDQAREILGTEQPDWPALAPETVAEKARLGYPGGPLLRSGQMRDDIGVLYAENGLYEIGIASSAPSFLYAQVQERGSKDMRVPARSFLGRSIQMHEREIVDGLDAALLGQFRGL